MGLISKLTRWFKGLPFPSTPTDSIRKWYKGEPFSILGASAEETGPGLAQPIKIPLTFTIREPIVTAVFNHQIRVSQFYTEVLYDEEPKLTTSQIYTEFLYSVVSAQPEKQSLTFNQYDPTVNTELLSGLVFSSAAAVDVLYSHDSEVDVSSSAVDVLYSCEPEVNISSAAIDVLYTVELHANVSLPVLSPTLTLREPAARVFEWDVHDIYYNELVQIDFIFEPSVNASLQHGILGLQAPTVHASSKAFPDTLSLLFTSYDAEAKIVFAVRHLTFSTQDPEIKFGQTVPVSTLLHAGLEWTPPDILLGYTTYPDIDSLEFGLHEPVASVGSSIKETLHLIINPNDQIVYLHTEPVADLENLEFSLHEPSTSTRIIAYSDLLHLQFTQIASEPNVGVNISTTQHLVFHIYNPEPAFDYVHEVAEILPLRFHQYGPFLWGFSSDPFVTEPLHVEGQYAAYFDMLNDKAYFERVNSALSSFFPGKDIRILTTTFWVRLASFYGAQKFVCKLSSTDDDNNSWGIGLYNSNCLYIWYKENDWPYYGGTETLRTEIYLEENKWYHIALMIDGSSSSGATPWGLEAYSPALYLRVWDRAGNRIKGTYRNSVKMQRSYYTNSKMRLGTAAFSLGHTEGGVDFLDGYLDEVVLFNAIRSPLETDAIRKFEYNGQIAGILTEEFGSQVGYHPYDGVKVVDLCSMIGYHPYNGVKVADFGLMVGYRITKPEVVIPFPVIAGLAPSFEVEVTYKFESDVFKREEQTYLDEGQFTESEERKPKIALPLISAKGILRDFDQSAFIRMAEVVRSGYSMFSMPIWCFKQNIVVDVKKGDFEFYVADSTEFRPGEKSLLIQASDFKVFDLCTNSAAAGMTVQVNSAVQHHYNTFRMPDATTPYDSRSSYAVPCITGVLTVEEVDLSRGPTFSSRVHVDGGVWTQAPIPAFPIDSFTVMPQVGRLLAPQISREALATEHGKIELLKYMQTSKLSFELEWHFHNTDWKLLRELFLSAQGRYGSFFIPLWLWEVKIVSPSTYNNLSQDLELQVTWPHTVGDDEMWKRFKTIYFQSSVDATKSYIVTLDSFNPVAPSVFRAAGVNPSPFTLHTGDSGSFGVNARFSEDSITFEFLGPNLCHVKASFTEAL